MTCNHPASRLTILNMSYKNDIVQEGSTDGIHNDLVRTRMMYICRVRCESCMIDFDLITVERDIKDHGDWSKAVYPYGGQPPVIKQ